jgi:hypothetical protein
MLPLPPHITVKKTVDLNKMCVLKKQLLTYICTTLIM